MTRLSETHQRELERLCRRYHVRRLELFGSASRLPLEEASDMDFLVEFQALASGTYPDTYFGLLEALEALFEKPVDLVVQGSIRNPFFRDEVESTKALVYAARD